MTLTINGDWESVLNVPQHQFSVFSTRREHEAIRSPCKRRHRLFMLGETHDNGASPSVPQEDSASAVPSCEIRAIRAEGQSRNPVRVLVDLIEQVSPLSRIYFHKL